MKVLNYKHSSRTVVSNRITTVRLPEETRKNLEFIAKALNKTKTEVIVEAINMYYEKEDNELDSYTLGLPYFPKEGDPGIGPPDLSENHKKYYYEALVEQHKRQSEEFHAYVEELRKKKAQKKSKKKEKQNERKNSN